MASGRATDVAANGRAAIELFGGGIHYLPGGIDILEDAPIILVSLDARGYFAYLNKCWEKLLGYSREECIHKPIVKFIYMSGQTSFDFACIKPRFGSAIKIPRLPLIDKSGEVRQFEYAACGVDNAIYGYLCPVEQGYSSDCSAGINTGGERSLLTATALSEMGRGSSVST